MQGATKAQLMEKFGARGEGVDSMSQSEKVRLKRMLALETIRNNNEASLTEK